MAQINIPEQAPPAKRYSIVGILLVMAILAVPVLIVGSVVAEMNTPAAKAQRDLRRAEEAVARAVLDEENKRMMDVIRERRQSPSPPRAAPPSPQRAAPPARQQSHRRMAYVDCVSHVVGVLDATGISPTITRSPSGNARSARFEFSDGVVVITCHRAEGVMTVELR